MLRALHSSPANISFQKRETSAVRLAPGPERLYIRHVALSRFDVVPSDSWAKVWSSAWTPPYANMWLQFRREPLVLNGDAPMGVVNQPQKGLVVWLSSPIQAWGWEWGGGGGGALQSLTSSTTTSFQGKRCLFPQQTPLQKTPAGFSLCNYHGHRQLLWLALERRLTRKGQGGRRRISVWISLLRLVVVASQGIIWMLCFCLEVLYCGTVYKTRRVQISRRAKARALSPVASWARPIPGPIVIPFFQSGLLHMPAT